MNNFAGYETNKYFDMYWQFIFERHLIWHKRFVQAQPSPWTKDWVLREFKFTNVYRELDRGTLFLLDHIINNDRQPMEQVFNIIVYRMFNRIETWEETGFLRLRRHGGLVDWDKETAFAKWRHMQKSGRALYTDAHMVCAYEHFPGKDKLERFEYIFEGITKGLPVLMKLIRHAQSLEPIWRALTKFPGIGPFLAYEIVVDISYCDWNALHENEWVNPGPGCQRGLRKMFPSIRPSECGAMIKALRDVQDKEFTRMGLNFSEIAYKGRPLTLRNIEHCCCEFFKYVKAIEGSGRPRNRFRPKAQKGNEDFSRLLG